MARPPCYEAPGAIYHVIGRSDGGKMVFDTEPYREAWLTCKEVACEKYGWLMHAWVLMGNHVHFLLETPVGFVPEGRSMLDGMRNVKQRARKRAYLTSHE